MQRNKKREGEKLGFYAQGGRGGRGKECDLNLSVFYNLRISITRTAVTNDTQTSTLDPAVRFTPSSEITTSSPPQFQ